MKKISFLLAFTLSLIFILILSSCAEKKYPDPSKDKFIIEKIEQNWLVLKPSVITKDSYKNPNNIFLTIKSVHDAGTITGDWYKKKDNVYQIFSLNFQTSSTLDDNLAYEIVDTINVNQELYSSGCLYNPLMTGSKILVQTYTSPGKSEVFYRNSEQNHLLKYCFTKADVVTQDSLIKYNPKTKSFITFASKKATETKIDIMPIIFIIALLALSLQIALRKRLDYFGRTGQWIEEETKRRLKKTRWGLIFVLITFNFVYSITWTDFYKDSAIIAGSFVFALLICAIGLIINMASIVIFFPRKSYSQEKNKIIQIVLIALIGLFNLLFFRINKELAAIGYLVICLPAIISLVQIIKGELKDAKAKKETPEN